MHVTELGFAVALGIEETIVQRPVLPAARVDVQTIDHPDALDQAVSVPAALQTHQFDAVRVISIQNRIVKGDAAPRGKHDIAFDVLPDHARRHFLYAQVALDRIMTEVGSVFGTVRIGEVGVTGFEKLAIDQTGQFQWNLREDYTA